MEKMDLLTPVESYILDWEVLIFNCILNISFNYIWIAQCFFLIKLYVFLPVCVVYM